MFLIKLRAKSNLGGFANERKHRENNQKVEEINRRLEVEIGLCQSLYDWQKADQLFDSLAEGCAVSKSFELIDGSNGKRLAVVTSLHGVEVNLLKKE